MSQKYLKRCSASLASKEMQTKTNLRFLSYHSQNGKDQENNQQQTLRTMWGKGNTHSLLVELQTGTVTLEINTKIPQKAKI